MSNIPDKNENPESKQKDDFWSSFTASPTKSEDNDEKQERSSWSMPWGSVHEDVRPDAGTKETKKTMFESKAKSTSGSQMSRSNDTDRLKPKSSISDRPKKGTVSKDKQTDKKDSALSSVKNVPHVKSKEKVESWDVSGWQEGEGHDIDLDLNVKTESENIPQVSLASTKLDSNINVETTIGDTLSKEHTHLQGKSEDIKSDLESESKKTKIQPRPPDEFKSDSLYEPQELIPVQSEHHSEKSGGSSSISVIDTISSVGVISLTDSSESDKLVTVESSPDLVVLGKNSPSVDITKNDMRKQSLELDSVEKDNSAICDTSDEVLSDKTSINLNDTDNVKQATESDDSNEVLEESKLEDTETETHAIITEKNKLDKVSSEEEITRKSSVLDEEHLEQTESTKDHSEDGSINTIIPSEENTPAAQQELPEGLKQNVPPFGSPSASIASSICSSETSKLDNSMDTCTSGTSDDTVVDPKIKLEEDEEDDITLDEDVKSHENVEVGSNEEDGIKTTDSIYSDSSGSSYVKCMIEEAMTDNGRLEDANSDSHSMGGEKSECSRSNGGNESGDDIDTTTSSDIEIISTPNSNNGECQKMVDLSPLKIALQKTARKGSPTHRRTDSGQSSISTTSREGQLSPGRDSYDEEHYGEDKRLSEEHSMYSALVPFLFPTES